MMLWNNLYMHTTRRRSKKYILIYPNCHKELQDELWVVDKLNLKEMEEVEPNGID